MYIHHKKNKRRIPIFFIVLFFIFLFAFVFFSFFSSLGLRVFSPVFVFQNNLRSGLNDFGSFFLSKKELVKENQNLKDENKNLNLKFSASEYALKENETLKEILGRKKSEDNFLLATPLNRDYISLYDSFLVDVGSKDGVLVGNMVFAYGDLPIGRVVEVEQNFSKVLLFSAPGEKTNVYLSQLDLNVEMVGRGGQNFEIILPRELEIEEGMNALLQEIDVYILAKVQKIISEKEDSFKKVLLISPVNIDHLRFVQIRR